MEVTARRDCYCNYWFSKSILTLTMISLCSTAVNPSISLLQLAEHNNTNQAMQDIFHSSALMLGMVNISAMIIGSLLAVFVSKLMMHCFSHGQIVALIHITYMFGHGLIFIAGMDNFWMFTSGRCLNGLALGIAAVLLEALFHETQTPCKRYSTGAVTGASYHMGAAIGFCLCLPLIFQLSPHLWIGMLLFGLLSSFALVMTERGMAEIESDKHANNAKESSKPIEKLPDKIHTFWTRQPFYGMAIFSCIMACAVNNYLFQVDKILMSIGWTLEYILCSFAGILVLGVFISFLSSAALRYVSLYPVLLIGIALVIASEAIVTMATTTRLCTDSNFSFCLVTSTCLFLAGFSIVCTTACAIAGSLLFDFSSRQSQLSFTAFVSIFWIVGWFVGLLSSALKILIGIHTFAVWVGLALVICIIVVFRIPNDILQLQENDK